MRRGGGGLGLSVSDGYVYQGRITGSIMLDW